MPAIDRRESARNLGAALVAAAAGPESPQWIERLRDGTTILIRPIRKSDAPLERAFIERLSPQTRRFRFLGQVHVVSDEQLRRFCDIDYVDDMAFVALVHEHGEKREIGVSRYCVGPDPHSAECALVVADEWQHRGVGTLLLRHLIVTARSRGLKRLYSIDNAQNAQMRELADAFGFSRTGDPHDHTQVSNSLEL